MWCNKVTKTQYEEEDDEERNASLFLFLAKKIARNMNAAGNSLIIPNIAVTTDCMDFACVPIIFTQSAYYIR